MTVKLSENAKLIIDSLRNAGFEAFAVGGAVRDSLMGRVADDFDITTSAKPEETKKVFSLYNVIDTGIKHGTVTVLVEDTPFEVTTYRSEKGYADSRHPDSVSFVNNVTEDLARRDFTMNAIAYSPYDGIVDPFCGYRDIQNKIIRTVGDPYKRFSEDALRILRALRFSSVLGFEIEDNTQKAIFALAENLKFVSSERIYAEMKKLICGTNAQFVINEYLQVFKTILPINGDYKAIHKLPNNCAMRLYCLFGESYKEALTILRADNKVKSVCGALSSSKPIPTDEAELKFYISALGKETAKTVISYRKSLFNEDRDNKAEILLNSDTPLYLSDLVVNGNDLTKLGIKGKAIGEALDILLKAVIKDEIINEKEALLKYLSSNLY